MSEKALNRISRKVGDYRNLAAQQQLTRQEQERYDELVLALQYRQRAIKVEAQNQTMRKTLEKIADCFPVHKDLLDLLDAGYYDLAEAT